MAVEGEYETSNLFSDGDGVVSLVFLYLRGYVFGWDSCAHICLCALKAFVRSVGRRNREIWIRTTSCLICV